MLTPIEQFVIEKVRQLRNQKNISQAELAFSIGVSVGFIGKSRKPQIQHQIQPKPPQ